MNNSPMSLRMLAVVGTAGMLGSVLRYAIGILTAYGWKYAFPLDILLINLSGSMFLGWFLGRTIHPSSLPHWVKVGIGTGFIGSFTTFSTFSVQSVEMVMKQGRWGEALIYVFASLWGGLITAWLGHRLALRSLWLRRSAGEST